MRRFIIMLLFACCLTMTASAQNKFEQPNLNSAGGGTSSNSTRKVFSVFGQSISNISASRVQPQAGFLQVIDYVVPDVVAPTITYTDGSQKINKPSRPTITATITDNFGLPTARLMYRKISGSTWSEALMIPGSNNTYSVEVQSNWFDEIGMEYYIEANDATPNAARSPNVSGTYYAYTTSSEETIPSTRIGFGTEQSNYKIIGVPYTIGSNDIPALFDEIGNIDKTKLRMYKYNTSTQEFLEYPAFPNLERGKGYWILVRAQPQNGIKIGPLEAHPENRANLFTMQLNPGWNMISNPYPVAIDWNDVKTYNIAKPGVGEFQVFNNGQWNNAVTISAYEGGFVYLDGESVDIEIPFAGQTSPGGRKATLSLNDISQKSWLVKLRISQGEMSNQLGGIGMHELASPQSDPFDDFNPPQFVGTPEINFPHPEHQLKGFARDVVPTQKKAKWQFNAAGQVGSMASLSWDNNLGNGIQELFLFDEVNLSIINLRTENQYDFQLSAQHPFSIHYGENILETIRPHEIIITPPFPNPTSSNQTPSFRLGLPDSQSHFSVSVEFLNGNGAVISSSYASLPSGVHEVSPSTFSGFASGIHFYRVRIESQGSIKVFTGKLIVL